MKKLHLLFLLFLSFSFSFGCCLNSGSVNRADQQAFLDHLNNSTVALVKKSAFGTKTYCSGFWINSQQFMTAKHCVSDTNDKPDMDEEVLFITYKEFDHNYPLNKSDDVYVAKVVAFGEDTDLAVLETKELLEHSVARIRRDEVYTGMDIHILSHPIGMNYNYTKGIVSQVRDMDVRPSGNIGRYYMVHVTASATFGSSGSGLFDSEGNFLGVACFVSNRLPTAIFYTHRDLLVEMLDKNDIKYY